MTREHGRRCALGTVIGARGRCLDGHTQREQPARGGVAGRGLHIPVSRISLAASLSFSLREPPFVRRSSSISRHEPQPRPFACVTLFLSYFFPLLAFGKPGPSAREPSLRIRRTEENPTLRDVGRGAIARPLLSLSLPLPVLLRATLHCRLPLVMYTECQE